MTTRKIIIGCAIAVGAVAAYWLLSPLFITRRVVEDLPAVVSNTPMPAASESEARGAVSPSTSPVPSAPAQIIEIVRGTFEGLAGHRAQGTARVIESGGKQYVRFESDFYVTNGPDLFVYLGRNGAYDPDARLGALKGNEGSQNYELPAGFDPTAHGEVWVWCRAFSVPFGKAVLTK